MRAFLHGGVEFDLEAEGISELQRAALERRFRKGASDAVIGKERGRLVEIAVVADLEAEPVAGGDRRFAQHQRVMLMLLDAAQIHRAVVAVLDMEADGGLVERAAGIEIHHVEHDVAGPDDIEGRIEDVLRNGHVVSFVKLVVDHPVIASEAKQSIFLAARNGLLRRKCSSQ